MVFSLTNRDLPHVKICGGKKWNPFSNQYFNMFSTSGLSILHLDGVPSEDRTHYSVIIVDQTNIVTYYPYFDMICTRWLLLWHTSIVDWLILWHLNLCWVIYWWILDQGIQWRSNLLLMINQINLTSYYPTPMHHNILWW